MTHCSSPTDLFAVLWTPRGPPPKNLAPAAPSAGHTAPDKPLTAPPPSWPALLSLGPCSEVSLSGRSSLAALFILMLFTLIGIPNPLPCCATGIWSLSLGWYSRTFGGLFFILTKKQKFHESGDIIWFFFFFFFFVNWSHVMAKAPSVHGKRGLISKGATSHKAAVSDKEASFLISLLPPPLLRDGPVSV